MTITVYWRRMFGGLLYGLAAGVLISKEGSDKDESIHGKSNIAVEISGCGSVAHGIGYFRLSVAQTPVYQVH